MYADAHGQCADSGTRVLRVELKANLWPSDPVLSADEDYAYDRQYYAVTESCDGGQTKEYYGRSFFKQNPIWVDDGYVDVETCDD